MAKRPSSFAAASFAPQGGFRSRFKRKGKGGKEKPGKAAAKSKAATGLETNPSVYAEENPLHTATAKEGQESKVTAVGGKGGHGRNYKGAMV